MGFWKSLGKILAAVVVVAAVVFAGPAIAAVASTIGATSAVGMAAAGALYGAAAGAVAGGLWTGNSKGIVKGAVIGGLIGGAAGAVGVGSSQGAFGSGIGSSGVAPVVPAAPSPAITQTTGGLESANGASVALPNTAGADAAAKKALLDAGTKVPTALETAAQSGKYMAYAEGVKLVAGGISGAAASKDRADELKSVNAKDDESKKNRDYQPIYKSNTIFAGKKSADETRRTFNETGLLNPMSPKVA